MRQNSGGGYRIRVTTMPGKAHSAPGGSSPDTRQDTRPDARSATANGKRAPSGAKPSAGQLDLFASDPVHAPPKAGPAKKSAKSTSKTSRGAKSRPAAATAPDEVQRLAEDLPQGLFMGTSSWSFPGWNGLVYDGKYSQSSLANHGLAAYAKHPLFRTVGIDRTFYAPIRSEDFASYAAAVPAHFRFLVKAHERLTLARYPDHPRYGRMRNQENDGFLDPAYAADAVVGPYMEGLGDKAGPLLFQFSPQPRAVIGKPAVFAERLHAFIDALPKGPLYAVEVRNANLLTANYAAALADVGACHCINLIGNMPNPMAQWRHTNAQRGPAIVVRWMLSPHLNYDSARQRYAPFDAIVDADQTARGHIANLVHWAGLSKQPIYVVVNNKAEGSAPLSILRLAEHIAAVAPAPPPSEDNDKPRTGRHVAKAYDDDDDVPF